ncbi:hypothetical protein EDF22_0619 [Rathayibacter sp. PhB127]|uniref:hypothetical protein n=1 Tax=Rathayibacter sp. PhB127 TaxID=2485176 RepID=UPI000FB92EA0|nr:hypothetical protein [Rathayibacter sp. PhB127]ROS28888.1 hypothetical protein EDF22_0619 [Rathayibacter sp. PhB127]
MLLTVEVNDEIGSVLLDQHKGSMRALSRRLGIEAEKHANVPGKAAADFALFIRRVEFRPDFVAKEYFIPSPETLANRAYDRETKNMLSEIRRAERDRKQGL